jgi:hypothetical protein
LIMSQTACTLEVPRLWIGLQGYDKEQAQQVRQWLIELQQSSAANIDWQIQPSSRIVDAHLFAHDSDIDAMMQATSEEAQSLVFHMPPAAWGVHTHNTMRKAFFEHLDNLEAAVMQQACLYVLASELVQRYSQGEVRQGLWHIISGETLLAVVDLDRLCIAVKSACHYLEYADAFWTRRSHQAIAPESFTVRSMEEVLWQYAQRTKRNVLPKRFAQSTLLGLRRYPRVALHLLSSWELGVIAQLRQLDMSEKQLASKLRLDDRQVHQVLSCLAVTGCLSVPKISITQKIKKLLGSDIDASPQKITDAPNSLPGSISTVFLDASTNESIGVR